MIQRHKVPVITLTSGPTDKRRFAQTLYTDYTLNNNNNNNNIKCAVYFQVPVWFDFKPHHCKINFVAPPEVRVPDLGSIYTQTFYQQGDLVGSSRYCLVPMTCHNYRHHSVLTFTADYNCSACTKISMYNLHITSLTNLFSEKNH